MHLPAGRHTEARLRWDNPQPGCASAWNRRHYANRRQIALDCDQFVQRERYALTALFAWVGNLPKPVFTNNFGRRPGKTCAVPNSNCCARLREDFGTGARELHRRLPPQCFTVLQTDGLANACNEKTCATFR